MDSEKLIEEKVKNQRSFFKKQHTKNLDFRIGALKKLKKIIQENEKALYEAIYLDFKKSKFETYATELALLYHDIDEALYEIKSWVKPQKVSTNLLNFPGKSRIYQEPLGTCLIIGAWNYPYQLSLAPCVPAIAAGNTVILKPSEIPSNTSALMAKLINENFDSEFFHVIEGGKEETQELLKQKFDKIFFTGSTTVGKIIYEAAAKNLTPVTLELGGKSPAIFTENCNLDVCVKRMVWAKFINAGQTCIAPDYILCPENMAIKLIEKIKEYIGKFNYSFENDNYVQIINDKNLERLEKLLDPNKIVYGGQIDTSSRFMEPTIMFPVLKTDAVMQEEIFGPILPILTYKNMDEAISLVQEMEKPLSCYVFTNDRKVEQKIISQISFGGGAINDALMHIANSSLPFGGVGQSGIGSYHGKAGFDSFSHNKSVFRKYNWLELKIKYSPYSNSKFKWIKRLFG